MSTLLDCLLHATPLPAATAAALASHTPKATNASHIIDSARASCTRDGFTTSYAALCVLLENQIRQLCHEINVLQGKGQRPARGCAFHESNLGAAHVLIEYEVEPASGDGWNEPRYEAQVTVLRVFINGQWCDAEDVASDATIERWTEEIVQGQEDSAEAAAESAAESRREDSRMRDTPFAIGWVTL